MNHRPPSPSQTLKVSYAEAVRHVAKLYDSGKIDGVEQLCQDILRANPNDYNALHFLGACANRRGRFIEALILLDKAVEAYPRSYKTYLNRGIALQALNRHREAIASYDKAISIKPDYAEAFCNRGNSLQALNYNQEAIASYDKAISIQPALAQAYSNRGIALQALNRHREAIASYDKAISIKPDYAEAYSNRGHSLQALNNHEQAIADYDRAISINPDYAESYCNRGHALQALNRHEEAIADYDKATSIQPTMVEAHTNRGIALQALNRHQEAISNYDKAILIRPNFAEAYCNRGYTLQALNRHQEAIEECDKAISIRPDYPEAKYIKAHSLLCFGLSEAAWRLYEQRLQSKASKNLPDLGLRLLGDNNPQGKRLLIQWEQRFGDVIQMLRYVPLLEDIADECWWQIQAPLRELAARSFPGLRQVNVGECPNHIEYRVPFTSLPLAMKTFTEEAIPKRVPYLIADPNKMSIWKHELQAPFSPSVTIGIVWRGNQDPPNRSFPIECLLPLFTIDRLNFVALQKEMTDAETSRLRKHPNVVSLGDKLNTFDDTASIVSAVDLLITIDTAIAHLAGALGKPTWILLKSGADWRWLLDREDSPWYPTARLFRQSKLGDWNGAIQHLRSALTELFCR